MRFKTNTFKYDVVMTSSTPHGTQPGVEIICAKFHVCTPSSFVGVGAFNTHIQNCVL